MGNFELARSIDIQATPGEIHGLIDNFHQWATWSPWEDLDPDMKREFSGSTSGVGAHYGWSGNRKAGAGTMEITESTPHQIVIALSFLKPFKAQNTISFQLVEHDGGSRVTWTMTGKRGAVSSAFVKIANLDAKIGADFDKGLAALKRTAEAGAARRT